MSHALQMLIGLVVLMKNVAQKVLVSSLGLA